MKDDRKKFRTEIPNMAEDVMDPFQYRLYGHYKRWSGERGHCIESLNATSERTRMSRDKIIQTRQWLVDNKWISVDQLARGVFKVTVVDRWNDNFARYSANGNDNSVDISTELYEYSSFTPVDISTSPVDISTSPVDISTSPVDISTTLERTILERTIVEGTKGEGASETSSPPSLSLPSDSEQEHFKPVPEPELEVTRITHAQILDARARAIKESLPDEIFDPPVRVKPAAPLPTTVQPGHVISTPNGKVIIDDVTWLQMLSVVVDGLGLRALVDAGVARARVEAVSTLDTLAKMPQFRTKEGIESLFASWDRARPDTPAPKSDWLIEHAGKLASGKVRYPDERKGKEVKRNVPDIRIAHADLTEYFANPANDFEINF